MRFGSATSQDFSFTSGTQMVTLREGWQGTVLPPHRLRPHPLPVGQFEPRTGPRRPDSAPARPPELGPPLGGVVGGGEVGAIPPPLGGEPEEDPVDGGAVVPLSELDASDVGPVDDAPAGDVVLAEPSLPTWLGSGAGDVLEGGLGAGTGSAVPVGALTTELGGGTGDVVAGDDAVDGVEARPGGPSEWADGSTRIVWVPGSETETGFAQPPSTAPPAKATTAPAASTDVPRCLLIA
jgi:hypothetical protein